MKVRSIWITATLAALAASFCAGCGAPADTESTKSEDSDLRVTGPGSGGLDPGVSITCGAYYTFDPSNSFEAALSSLGCQAPRHAFATAGSNESLAFCPTYNQAWLQALCNSDQYVAPIYSVLRTGNSTCSSYKTPIPSGYVEVSWDPNCSGANCGSLRQSI